MAKVRIKAAGDALTIGLAQVAPVWLNREKTLSKVTQQVEQAAAEGCHLVAFGEALVPGYPFWIERTDGARFNSPVQKEIHAHYADQAIMTDFPADTPHLDKILSDCPEILANGGSCLASPDGEWMIQPVVDKEALMVAVLEPKRVREERQNFDPSGHYARPDVIQLTVCRDRQCAVIFKE